MYGHKVNELAEELRKEGLNFVFVVENEWGKVYSQSSTTKGSKLKGIQEESLKLSTVGRELIIPGQEEIGK